MTDTSFTPNNFWHMQMHPTDAQNDFAPNIPYILEHRGFIGLGHFYDNNGNLDPQIAQFNDKIQVNDIIAIRNGAKFIALVQVIGGAYHIKGDADPRTKWIKHRRPVRVLDWEIDGKLVRECPAPMGTLNRCASDNADTTQIIKDWYHKVAKSLTARELPLSV